MKKKIMFFLLGILISSNLNATVAGVDAADISPDNYTELKFPLFNIFASTQWSLLFQQFSIKMKVGTCGEGLDYRLGFVAHMIEPLGYFETTKKPLFFPFAGFDLGGNILKSGTSRHNGVDDAARDEFMFSHFIYAPILGMIFKKKLQVFCFHQGEIALPYLSEFIPSYQKDLMFKNMIAPMVVMFTPVGLLSCVIDSVSTDALNATAGYAENARYYDAFNQTSIENTGSTYSAPTSNDENQVTEADLKSKGTDYLRYVYNSMYFSVGALGFGNVGGYVEAQDPLTDIEGLLHESFNLLHGASTLIPKPILYKQTNFTVDSTVSGVSANESMCAPVKYPLIIKTQIVPQRAYPTVGFAHVLGSPGMMHTTAANLPGSKDSGVLVVWYERDYYAFAYQCPDGL